MTDKKMFKVLCPMERNGVKWWARMGSAFRNRDESINVYLDAIPVGGPFTLQLREMTDEELKQSAERRSTRTTTSNGRADASFDPSVHSVQALNSNQSVPF